MLAHVRGEKLRVFKFKPKRGYKRRTGHRQELTQIEVTEIAAGRQNAAPSGPNRSRRSRAGQRPPPRRPKRRAPTHREKRARPKPSPRRPKPSPRRPKPRPPTPKRSRGPSEDWGGQSQDRRYQSEECRGQSQERRRQSEERRGRHGQEPRKSQARGGRESETPSQTEEPAEREDEGEDRRWLIRRDSARAATGATRTPSASA